MVLRNRVKTSTYQSLCGVLTAACMRVSLLRRRLDAGQVSVKPFAEAKGLILTRSWLL